jgi:hypothetical protein
MASRLSDRGQSKAREERAIKLAAQSERQLRLDTRMGHMIRISKRERISHPPIE